MVSAVVVVVSADFLKCQLILKLSAVFCLVLSADYNLSNLVIS